MNKEEITKRILELEEKMGTDISKEDREIIQDNLHELRKKLNIGE